MKILLLSVLLISGQLAIAQKKVNKSILLPSGHLLEINAGQCYSVELETAKGRHLIVEAVMEGEYKGELLLQISTEGGTTSVNAGLQPLFGLPEDKLGAHKVISIALKIYLPHDQRVQLFGHSSQITAKGRYSHLQVYLEEGQCSLLGVSDWAEVITRDADINLESPAAIITANSKYGMVSPHQIPPGTARFHLQTISGNIQLLRRE